MLWLILYDRLLLLLARLSVGLVDEEAGKLEAALTPLVHSGQEQVGRDEDDDRDDLDQTAEMVQKKSRNCIQVQNFLFCE